MLRTGLSRQDRQKRMVRRIEFLIGQIVAGSARPGWTLLADSCLFPQLPVWRSTVNRKVPSAPANTGVGVGNCHYNNGEAVMIKACPAVAR
jgi:hypothetical protein